MIRKIISTIFFGLVCICIQAQKFSTLSSDFSILEKNTLKDSSYLVKGTLHYDLNKDLTVYQLDFPFANTWEFKDTILTVYDSSKTIVRRDTIGNVSEMSMFKKILTNDLHDFGLKESGFQIDNVERAGNSVIFVWKPPQHITFIDQIISQEVEKKLSGIIFIDEHGKEFNKTFYQDYVNINTIEVPTRIKSHYIGQEEQIFKEIQLRNVVIK